MDTDIREARQRWREFLLSFSFNERGVDRVKKALSNQYDLLPHPQESFWVPWEWGRKKDLICVSVGGQEDPLDLYVHEASHAKWTWRSEECRKLLQRWGALFNLAEDIRVEYLALSEWGWVFQSWTFPQVPSPPPSQEDDLFLWGLYVLNLSASTGRDIPEEWRDILQPVWEKLRRAYGELILVKTEEEMDAWLRKYLPHLPAMPPGLSQQLLGDVSPFNNDWKRKEEKGRCLLEELSPEGGRQERGEWFTSSATVTPSPALLSLLARLAGEGVERVNSLWGRYNPRRDMRGREDCFRISRTTPSPEVVFIVDTSGSMKDIAVGVRELLWGINALSKKGTLKGKGKVIFVSGGRALPVSLPTKLPIEQVAFNGGTNGYKNALPHIPQDALVVFLSDLLIDSSDRDVIRSLGARAYFLYGGREVSSVEKEARELGLPRQRCFFAPNVREALERLLKALGL